LAVTRRIYGGRECSFYLFYSGRDDANYDKVIHTGQAEIRAYF